MEQIILQIPSHPKCLCLAREAVGMLATQLGFNEKEVSHIVLATDEACTNVIRHVYKGLDKRENKIILKVVTYKNKIRIRIRDFGGKVSPHKIRGRKLCRIRPGGLGVHFIHGCMDKVVYHTRFKKGTELEMVKVLKRKR